ncbi:hypothetical protein WJX73_010316 [Symbiochloris irregularis]|uniref:Uncharacterized protein n=1 Tax=Symbiochloris irregularis TaxID=706552 RepID=A0AAW1PIR6_9CHLO
MGLNILVSSQLADGYLQRRAYALTDRPASARAGQVHNTAIWAKPVLAAVISLGMITKTAPPAGLALRSRVPRSRVGASASAAEGVLSAGTPAYTALTEDLAHEISALSSDLEDLRAGTASSAVEIEEAMKIAKEAAASAKEAEAAMRAWQPATRPQLGKRLLTMLEKYQSLRRADRAAKLLRKFRWQRKL